MKLLKSICVSSLLVCGQLSLAMQQPTQKKEITPTLGGLPIDLKRYLMPFVASGFPAFAARGMVNFAGINKEFNRIANDENTMLAFLENYRCTALYEAHVVDVGLKLLKKPKTFPVVQDIEIKSWLDGIAMQLEAGHALFLAATNNRTNVLKQLLTNKKLDLNWNRLYFGDSYLHVALEKYHMEVATLLVKAGADPDESSTMHSRFPLEFYKLLFEYGANPNYRSKDSLRRTRLIMEVWPARWHGNIWESYIMHLLQVGADPDLKDGDGKTARDYMRDYQHQNARYRRVFKLLGRAHYDKKLKNAKTVLAQIDQSAPQ